MSLLRYTALYVPQAPTGGTVYEVTVTDAMFFFDGAPKDRESVLAEGMLLNDARASVLERLATLGLLLDDSSTSALERTAAAMDSLFMLDTTTRAQESATADQVLLQDATARTAESARLDSLLFDDGSQNDLAALQHDGIFMGDSRSSEAGMQQHDPLLLYDQLHESLEKIVNEGVLLYDSAAAIREFVAIVSDAILLNDATACEIDKAFLDMVLIPDMLYRVLEALQMDHTLLADSSLVERITYGLDVLITDGILMFDAMAKQQDHAQSESVFLNDERFMELHRNLADYLLSVSTVTKTAEINMIERLLLGELLDRAQELVTTEGFLLYDASVVERLVIGAQFLTFARLKSANLLGIFLDTMDYMAIRGNAGDYLARAIDAKDFLAPRISDFDYMGRTIGINHWRPME